MHKKLLFCLILIISRGSQAQNTQFAQASSMQEVVAKAILERKMIFVDCFASWCLPCKKMDDSVYTDTGVAAELDRDFICVKVQMDSTGRDNAMTKAWYQEADDIQRRYVIQAYPSFLFLSSTGEIVHRAFGYMAPGEFIRLLKSSQDSNLQYYTLLHQYVEGGRNFGQLKYLANLCQSLGDDTLAYRVASDYIDGYLMHIDQVKLFTLENFQFIGNFTEHSSDRWFHFFRDKSAMIDSMFHKGYCREMVDYVITKEEIEPVIWGRGGIGEKLIKPNWETIIENISRKYSLDYAERTVINAKIRWYTYNKDWPHIIESNVEKVDRFGVDTAGWGRYFLNNMIWEVAKGN